MNLLKPQAFRLGLKIGQYERGFSPEFLRDIVEIQG